MTTTADTFAAALREQDATMAFSAAAAMDYTDSLVVQLSDRELRALHRAAARLESAARWDLARRSSAAARTVAEAPA